MSLRSNIAALILVLTCQTGMVAYAADNNAVLEPEEFSRLVQQKKYKEAHDTALSEAKLVPEELDYVRNNKLVPYDKRHIYLRRPLEYYEVLLATGEDAQAQMLEKEMFKTLPEKSCVQQMLMVSNRVNNENAVKRLNTLKNQCK